MHLHTDAGVAVSSTRDGLLPLNQHAMFVWHDVAYHDWEGVALDLDERERLIADLGTHNLMILRNHGTLAAGASVQSCFLRLYYLERACAIQTRALAAGEPNPISDGAADMMKTMLSAPTAWESIAAQAWPALLRLMDREKPGYGD